MEYVRVVLKDTGRSKVGGNYAVSFLPHHEAVEKDFADYVSIDSKTYTKQKKFWNFEVRNN